MLWSRRTTALLRERKAKVRARGLVSGNHCSAQLAGSSLLELGGNPTTSLAQPRILHLPQHLRAAQPLVIPCDYTENLSEHRTTQLSPRKQCSGYTEPAMRQTLGSRNPKANVLILRTKIPESYTWKYTVLLKQHKRDKHTHRI